MKCKGIIFDFNGTMYFDRDYNDEAWLKTINSLADTKIEDLHAFTKGMKVYKDLQYVKGVMDKLGKSYDDKRLYEVSIAKEKLYQKIILEHHDNQLAPGLEELLNQIKSLGIPYTIASMAPEINFDFYLDYLKLSRWFKKEEIIYDDFVTYDDKYQMYLDAAKLINLDLSDCLVFEDSPSGIKSATDAGCKNVIMIERPDNLKTENKAIVSLIKDYRNLNLKDYIEL